MNIKPRPEESFVKSWGYELTGEYRRPVLGDFYVSREGNACYSYSLSDNLGSEPERWILRKLARLPLPSTELLERANAELTGEYREPKEGELFVVDHAGRLETETHTGNGRGDRHICVRRQPKPSAEDLETMGMELTGEYRAPKRGEFVVMHGATTAYVEGSDRWIEPDNRWIMRRKAQRTPKPTPQQIYAGTNIALDINIPSLGGRAHHFELTGEYREVDGSKGLNEWYWHAPESRVYWGKSAGKVWVLKPMPWPKVPEIPAGYKLVEIVRNWTEAVKKHPNAKVLFDGGFFYLGQPWSTETNNYHVPVYVLEKSGPTYRPYKGAEEVPAQHAFICRKADLGIRFGISVVGTVGVQSSHPAMSKVIPYAELLESFAWPDGSACGVKVN